MAADFSTSELREAAGKTAGDNFQGGMEDLSTTLATQEGSSLGTMVSTQLSLTEIEMDYKVEKGLPEKATKEVNKAADGVASAARS